MAFPGAHRGGLLVFRFLGTLVAPYNALFHLRKQPLVFAENAQVKFVTFAPPRDDEKQIPQDQLDEMRAGLEKAVKLLDDDTKHACSWIEERFKKYLRPGKPAAGVNVPAKADFGIFKGNIHAEAGIMALSCLGSRKIMVWVAPVLAISDTRITSILIGA